VQDYRGGVREVAHDADVLGLELGVFGVGDDPERAEVLAGVGDWKTPY
jgi:hypothetical protein